MSFEDQDIQSTVSNADVPAQTVEPEAAVPPTAPEMPAVAQAELVAEPAGIQVADASEEAEWLFEALEEEAEDEAEEADYEEAEAEEASADDDAQADADADVSGEAGTEATAEAGGGEAAGGAAASSGGISSAWLWGGLAVAGAAAAASNSGDSGTPPPDAPTVSLDDDSGTDGDGVTNSAVFSVGGLENDTTWEYSTDGGTTWTSGSGSSFEITSDGDYTVVVRQSRGGQVSQVSASVAVTLDTSSPEISSGDSADIDENVAEGTLVYTVEATDSADITYTLAESSDSGLSIDSATGAVTLTGSPDQETKASYAFTVVATDIAGNTSEQAVTLTINDLDDTAPSITSGATVTSINENTAADQVIYTATADDTADVSSGDIVFSLKPGSDEALSIDGATGAVTLADAPDFEAQSSYNFTVIATDAAGNSNEQALTLNINDMAPQVLTVAGDSTTDTVRVTFNDPLSGDPLPDVSTFAVSQGGNPIAVNSLAVDGSSVVLNLGGDLVAGPVQIVYTPGDGNNVTDTGGNESAGFTQLVVSDGYIRGASIYLDANNNGIAEAEELIEGATTDAKGQVILPDDIEAGTLLIVGGVNMDTGAVNKIIIKTKVGNTAANPLTTLVETVKASGGLTDEEAEQIVAKGLGITLQEGQSLSTYDPIADTTPEGLAARKAVATVATILASAANTAEDTATSDAVVSAVASNIATALVTAATNAPDNPQVTFDEATLQGVLGQAVADSTVAQNVAQTVAVSVQTIANTDSIDVIVQTQAQATDTIAPDAPEAALASASDTGASSEDGVTSDATPTITVSFETETNDGTAVVAGNVVSLLSGDTVVGTVTLTEEDIAAGTVDVQVEAAKALADGAASITARVTDKAGNDSVLSTQISLTIDTQGPQIGSGVEANIDENDGSDVVVFETLATDANTITYTLADGASSDLTINSETGVVTLAGADFETAPEYQFTVVATDLAGNKSERAVTLSINNVDEVAPTIESGATAQAIDENSGAGQVVYTAVADDSGDITGGVKYSLSSDSDAGLTIDPVSGEVTLEGNPDAEIKSVYNFTIIATDEAGNVSDPQSVTLDINNLDEVAPVITSGATASLNENSPVETVVYTATSTDDEDVVTGATTYSLGDGSDVALTIDPDSGEVRLNGVANFEQQSSYTFFIEAMDAAGNKAARKEVTLSINNLDEEAPVITSVDDVAAVNENIPAGALIYTAEATDTDVVSGAVTFSLRADSTPGLSIDPSSGEVTLDESPDFETRPEYTFTVVATDAAGNFDEKTLTLKINDQDEGPPQFTSLATASVDENNTVDTPVYTASATDFGTVTYSLAPEDESTFTIDSSTGEVRLIASPDFEQQSEYTFTVTATDDSPGANASDLEVTLTVNNLDEADPVITSGDMAAAIDENSGANQVVYTVTSTDTGDIATGETAYSLAQGHDEALSIDGDTGEVRLSVNPDAELNSSYTFTVVATDAAGNSSEQQVTLQITDLDESNPVITSESSFTIDENGPATAVVYTATATDDQDIDTGLTFSLSDSSPSAFSINPNSGEVTFAGPADFENPGQTVFTVIVTDGAGNKDERTVTMLVNNLDDTAPEFTSSDEVIAIEENIDSTLPITIYQASATDDNDISEGFSFSLTDDSDAAISIDATTGVVTLNEIPDFETQESYDFTVVVSDVAGNSTEKQLTLNVTNVDDTAPSITSANSGNALVGTPYVYVATADDSGDISEGITFSLAQTGDADLLRVDTEENGFGVVSLRSGFVDPEFEGQTLTFTLIATDAAGNSSQQDVTITVPAPTLTSVSATINGQDDVIESFILDGGTSTVTSGTGPDVFVALFETGDQISITDFSSNDDIIDFTVALIEAGYNSSTDFSQGVFSGQATFKFEATTADADLIAANSADFDNVYGIYADTANGTIVGFYDGNAAAGSVEMVTFTLDVGEAAALVTTDEATAQVITGAPFTSGNQAFIVRENNLGNEEVYTASVEQEQGVTVTFGLQAGVEDLFTIDAQTGVVTFIGAADYEQTAQYSFTVIAVTSDGRESRQSVVMAVENVDESAPVFTSDQTGDALVGTPYLYRATVDDTADTSAGVIFSLENSGDYELLQIDPEDGAVSLRSGVVLPPSEAGGPAQYTFTVIADDGVTTPSTQTVTVDVPEPTVAQGPGVIQQGAIAIVQSETDGVVKLEFVVDDAYLDLFPGGVSSYSLDIGFDESLFEPISLEVQIDEEGNEFFQSANFETSLVLWTVNPEVDNVLGVGGVTFSSIKVANGEPLGSLFLTPLATTTSFTIATSAVVLGNSTVEFPDTVFGFGDSATVLGTDALESFIMAGGDVSITGGGNIDLFVATATTGDQTVITDFTPTGEETDYIDMSLVLLESGYESEDETATSVVDFQANLFAGTSINNLGQIQADAVEFDNTYGILVDDANGVIVGFYDTDPLANSVAMQTFSVSVGAATAALVTSENVNAQLNEDMNAGGGGGNPVEPTFAFTSGASVQGLTGTPFLYQAEVNSFGLVQFSLDQTSPDYDLLSIDSDTGVVMLKAGVLDVDLKDQYTFTVIASDGFNAAISKTVTSSLVASTTVVGGNDSVTQGGILVEETSMSDQPPYELSFYVSDEFAVGNYLDGMNAFTFSVNYDTTQFAAIAASDFTVNTAFEATIDDSTPGVFVVSGTLPQDGSAYDPANGGALASVSVTPTAEGQDIAIDITNISFTDALDTPIPQDDTNLVFGSVAIEVGTANNDSFVIGSGVMDITGGEGVDAYIITTDTGVGGDLYITDFATDEDFIDMSQLLIGLDYQSVGNSLLGSVDNGVVTKYSSISSAVLDLIANNDSQLDNTFGMSIDDQTGIITGFYDADSAAGSVTIETFEFDVGGANIDIDDLTAAIGGFIA